MSRGATIRRWHWILQKYRSHYTPRSTTALWRLPVTESAAVPKTDSTVPIDSGGESTGPKAISNSLSASKAEEKASHRHADRPRSIAVVAGMGLELAGTTVVMAGFGHLVDRQLGASSSFGFALGGLVGFGLGMLRFILKALRQIEDSDA